jgi:hypothetical protein
MWQEAVKAFKEYRKFRKEKGSRGESDDSDTPIVQAPYPIRSFDRGGKVRKTGLAKLRKGERVLTPSQSKRYSKRRGRRSRSKSR